MPTLKGIEVSLLSAMFLVSCIFFNKCFYFPHYMAGYILDRPHIYTHMYVHICIYGVGMYVYMWCVCMWYIHMCIYMNYICVHVCIYSVIMTDSGDGCMQSFREESRVKKNPQILVWSIGVL